jgi:hypothetical protein
LALQVQPWGAKAQPEAIKPQENWLFCLTMKDFSVVTWGIPVLS